MNRKLLLVVALFLGSLLLLGGAGYASPGTTERVSVDSVGTQANGPSAYPAISGDYVCFQSVATNLVPDDTNGVGDCFLHDLQTGITERVSLDSAGGQGNGSCHSYRGCSPTPDGLYAAFSSWASNLVPGDTNGQRDVFVRDRQAGTTVRVSVDSAGNEANGASDRQTITGDGRYVAFQSSASNLVPGFTSWVQVYLHDRQTDETERISEDILGNQANNNSHEPSISSDGRYVAFYSAGSNLVPGDTNASSDVFVKDRTTGSVARVSVDSVGNQGNGGSTSAQISGGGRYVAFQSDATNLVPGDTNAAADIFLRDRVTGTTQRVSVSTLGNQADGESTAPSISQDGRFVAFNSLASNLVDGDTNGHRDVFVHDRLSGITARLSVDSAGNQANDDSDAAALAASGRYVAFHSDASNLVADDTNGWADVFVHDLWHDGDGDGCGDTQEWGLGFDPSAWYDFYDVPVPANPDPTPNGPRDRAVAMDDVLAVLFYVGTFEGDTADPPNANGVRYDTIKDSCDWDVDTVADKDGICYDRSPGPTPNPPWDAGPPSGAVSMDDVLALLAQVGLSCVEPP